MSDADQPSQNPIEMFDPMSMLTKLFNVIVENLMDITASFATIFIRKDFGERFLTLTTLTVCAIGVQMLGFVGGGNTGEAGNWTRIYGLLYIAMGAWHLFSISRRNRAGIEWHSRCPGISRLEFLPLSLETIQKYVEPALVFVIALLVSPLSSWLSGILTVGAVGILIGEHVRAAIRRNEYLDMVDQKIKGTELHGSMVDGKPPSETKGLNMAVPRHMKREDREALARVWQGKDPNPPAAT